MAIVAVLFALVALAFAGLIVLLVVQSRKNAKQKDQARAEQQAARMAAMMAPPPSSPGQAQSIGQAASAFGAQAAEAARQTAPGNAAGLFKNMPSGDAMYAMTFPDIAPLFTPEGLLAWHAWYCERHRTRQIIRDGRRWRGAVPGFPQAAAMLVLGEKTAGPVLPVTDTVTLQDESDVVLTEMRAALRADGSATLTVAQGRFTLTPDDAECKVRFEGDAKGKTRSFEWKGPGQWRINAAQGMPRVQTRDDDDLDWDDDTSTTSYSSSSSYVPATSQSMAAALLAHEQMAVQAHEQTHLFAATNPLDPLSATAPDHGVSGDSFSDNASDASGTGDPSQDAGDALRTDY